MKRGFTLIEMLVVMGIIAVLVAAGMASYTGAVRTAQRARGNELVHDVQVALVAALQNEDCWPQAILAEGSGGNGLMTARVGGALVKRNLLTGAYKSRVEKKKKVYDLSGIDKYGILSPWAMDVVRKLFATGSLGDGTKVPSGGTIADHRLRFAIDADYDGITEVAREKGKKLRVRANACVWCCGYDGKFGTKDDIQSWAKGQEVK